jgi:hypothetical protein
LLFTQNNLVVEVSGVALDVLVQLDFCRACFGDLAYTFTNGYCRKNNKQRAAGDNSDHYILGKEISGLVFFHFLSF